MKIFWKKEIFGEDDESFDFYYDVYKPLAKRFPWLRWLNKECPWSYHGYSWYHMLTTPKDLWSEIRDRMLYAHQRMRRGYDKPATYNISRHLSVHIPKLLKDLKAWGNGYPCGMIGHGAVATSEDDPGLIEWHKILDEMVSGFEAANKLISRESPIYEEFHEEWEKRYPNTPTFYFANPDADGNVEMKWPPEYYSLREELKVSEREKEWRNEQLKLFHRGMILFHQYYFDLWD